MVARLKAAMRRLNQFANHFTVVDSGDGATGMVVEVNVRIDAKDVEDRMVKVTRA